VIGLGIGEQHVVGYLKNPTISRVFVYDIDPRKVHNICQKYENVDPISSFEKICINPTISFVSVASYDSSHCNQVVQLIKSQKNIFVEKPLCTSYAELNLIKSTYQKYHGNNLLIKSNFILRKERRFQTLKQKIINGDLGEIYYAEGSYDYGRYHKLIEGWRADEPNYSVMNGGGIHIIDLFQYLTGHYYKPVSSIQRATQANTAINDLHITLGYLGQDCVAKVGCVFNSQTPHYHQIKIYGTRGTFVHDCGQGQYFFNHEPNVQQQQDRNKFPDAKKYDLIDKFIEESEKLDNKEGSFDHIYRIMESALACSEIGAL
jgi:predicted dehydrogenase